MPGCPAIFLPLQVFLIPPSFSSPSFSPFIILFFSRLGLSCSSHRQSSRFRSIQGSAALFLPSRSFLDKSFFRRIVATVDQPQNVSSRRVKLQRSRLLQGECIWKWLQVCACPSDSSCNAHSDLYHRSHGGYSNGHRDSNGYRDGSKSHGGGYGSSYGGGYSSGGYGGGDRMSNLGSNLKAQQWGS